MKIQPTAEKLARERAGNHTSGHAPAPDLVPTTNGLVVQGSHLGQLAGPPLLGALAASAGGWQLSPIVFVTAAGIGVMIAIGLRRHEPHP